MGQGNMNELVPRQFDPVTGYPPFKEFLFRWQKHEKDLFGKGGDCIMARYGLIVDLNICTGCMTCMLACKQENLTRPGIQWTKMLELESPTLDQITYVRQACMHCDDPPCVEACPSKAISKRADGIVLIDQKKCVGSRDA